MEGKKLNLHSKFHEFIKDTNSYTFVDEMEEDQESKRHWPNQTSREVHSGHYVRFKTQPLEMPELVLFSDEMAAALNVEPMEG